MRTRRGIAGRLVAAVVTLIACAITIVCLMNQTRTEYNSVLGTSNYRSLLAGDDLSNWIMMTLLSTILAPFATFIPISRRKEASPAFEAQGIAPSDLKSLATAVHEVEADPAHHHRY
jgi:hypothetical protein